MRLLPLVALLTPTLALAQAQAQAPVPAPTAAPTPLPDIEFAATVRMESIEFGSEPRAQVRFDGGPRLQTRHDVERDRLPRPVAAGRAYRDATVRTTISATLLDPALDARVDADGAPASPPNDEDTP